MGFLRGFTKTINPYDARFRIELAPGELFPILFIGIPPHTTREYRFSHSLEWRR